MSLGNPRGASRESRAGALSPRTIVTILSAQAQPTHIIAFPISGALEHPRHAILGYWPSRRTGQIRKRPIIARGAHPALLYSYFYSCSVRGGIAITREKQGISGQRTLHHESFKQHFPIHFWCQYFLTILKNKNNLRIYSRISEYTLEGERSHIT